MKHIWGRPQKN